MITITAQIYEVIQGESKNRDTGEIKPIYTVSALHKENGKPVLTDLKIDFSVFESWHKHIGQEFTAEVRPWNMTQADGKVNKGYGLVDKKALPTILSKSLQK